MEDTIRRSDAINLCEKWRNRTNEHHDKNGWYIADTLLKATKELPSADRWIPCSERMPMYNVDVLVYRPTMGQKIIVDSFCGYYGDDIDDLDEWYEGWGISREHPVTAWMPLPEPWKGADDGIR